MYNFAFATVGTLLRWIFRVIFRWRVTGLEHIPPGGAVLSPNHLSYWDIPLIALAVPRRVHFMAKEELFHVPVFGAVILCGLIGGYMYNRFKDIRLPDYLAFFGGRRFVPIVTGFACLFLAV